MTQTAYYCFIQNGNSRMKRAKFHFSHGDRSRTIRNIMLQFQLAFFQNFMEFPKWLCETEPRATWDSISTTSGPCFPPSVSDLSGESAIWTPELWDAELSVKLMSLSSCNALCFNVETYWKLVHSKGKSNTLTYKLFFFKAIKFLVQFCFHIRS